MDAKLKTKWIRALRSGRYKQGEFFFEKDGSYCCLGVLCVVAKRRPMTAAGDSNWKFAREVIDCPHDGPDDEAMNLAHMNDDGKSFAEIADYIEKRL